VALGSSYKAQAWELEGGGVQTPAPSLDSWKNKIKIYKKNKEIQHTLIPKIKIVLKTYSSILNTLE
jgi:hypothetical protein